ncbi:hypothetical protein NOR_03449 [Metarhizium rileyi]|uniref:Uncharacterized protein n=1 Tax=Metarhizium rileyi (strain RCEF 4871) TaxID=1649241 RepID=A0A162LVY1_METRR|nr:hypothetical protein NOR_03449 [Metarhizium rileyi RCEF 4871]
MTSFVPCCHPDDRSQYKVGREMVDRIKPAGDASGCTMAPGLCKCSLINDSVPAALDLDTPWAVIPWCLGESRALRGSNFSRSSRDDL